MHRARWLLGGENEGFFPQLAVASLITGIGSPAALRLVGQNFPASQNWHAMAFERIYQHRQPACDLRRNAVGVLGTQGGLFLALYLAIWRGSRHYHGHVAR